MDDYGCITRWMYLRQLNCTLKMVKMINLNIMCILLLPPPPLHTHTHTHTHTHRKSMATQELNDQVTRHSPSSPCPTGSEGRSPSPRLSQMTAMLVAADLRKKVSHCSSWRKNLSLLLKRKLSSSGTLVDEVRITCPQALDAFLC